MVDIKFKNNDIYALKIKDKNSEYYGNYLIIIKSKVEGWPIWINKRLFRFKISKSTIVPKLEDVNNLEFIKVSWCHYLNAVEIPKSNQFDENFKKDIKEAKKMADKYGYLYIYLAEIYFYKDSIPDDIIYLGNKDIEKPKDEYIPSNVFSGKLNNLRWEHIKFELVKSYKDNNLQESPFYNKEASLKVKRGSMKFKMIQKYAWDKVQKGLDNGINYSDEIALEDSLTYVGGENEDPYEEK